MSKMSSQGPQIVEFFGLPRTGKTTLSDRLVSFIQEDRSIQVEKISERASLCPLPKLDRHFNWWTSIATIKAFLESKQQGVDLLISDRGLLDAVVWLQLFSKRDKVDHLSTFLPVLDAADIGSHLVRGYFFSASIDDVLDRNNRRTGTIMNRRILGRYMEAYGDVRGLLRERFPIVEFDSSKVNLEDIWKTIADDISKLIEMSAVA
jgi:hypothetical protein